MAGIACGSQIILCDLPIRLDTYQGCSHFCRYCFVRKQYDISNIKPVKCAGALRNFISGKRPETVNWCDWDIPLHWGGVSDPFQPAERLHRASLQCLDVFADTGYPFVFSTKGQLVVEPEYLARIRASRCVAQVSMVCSRYDQMETGAPSYDERLGMCEKTGAKRLARDRSCPALSAGSQRRRFEELASLAGCGRLRRGFRRYEVQRREGRHGKARG